MRCAANVYERTLWTVVYRNKNGDYSINNNCGYCLSGFVKSHDEVFSQYIKLVYRLLLKNNNILISDEKGATNFYLSVSYPDRWSIDDKDDYVDFINDTLKEFNVKVLWAINARDAAFFTYGYFYQYATDECMLSINYGSTDIDYTVFDRGREISDDSWSNVQLGASNIEKALLQDYRRDMDYQQKCVVTQDKLDELGLNFISINSELVKELRK